MGENWEKWVDENKKSGGAGSSSTPKEVEKKKSKGKKKAVAEEEEREQESSGKKEMKNSKKKKNMVAVEEGDDENEREEGPQCKFPMNRIQKIMKDHDASARLAQEAIFLANKASEKFLELYCREAYACAFLDHKKQVSYDHLASVVSKRKRFDFLSDIIPQRVKAEDALAEVSDK
nr:chromatin accessibility complex protein 1 [Coffea arabica]